MESPILIKELVTKFSVAEETNQSPERRADKHMYIPHLLLYHEYNVRYNGEQNKIISINYCNLQFKFLQNIFTSL
jgi:hypothetical protein